MPPVRTLTSSLAAAFTVAGTVAVLAAPPPSGTFVELSPLPGHSGAIVVDGAPRGATAGWSFAQPDGMQLAAVLWNRLGTPTALAPLPGDPESRALAVNASGRVVGDSGVDLLFATAQRRAVVWERDGSVTALPLLPGTEISFATGVNPRGQIVGKVAEADADGQVPVRWEPDGTITVLTLPQAVGVNSFKSAAAINAHGEIVGTYDPAGPRKPIFWDQGGVGRELETPPNRPSGGAADLNERGEACGFISVNSAIADARGAHWDAGGTLTVLDPLPGDVESQAQGIGPSGVVVGMSQAADGTTRPVQWPRGSSTPVELPLPPGFTNAVAVEVEPAGRVLLWAWSTPDIFSTLAAFALD